MVRLIIPVSFSDDDAMRAMGLPEDMLEEMLPTIYKTRETACAKALYGAADVTHADEDGACVAGVRMRSRILAVNLADQKLAVPYVCTCGRELHELSLGNPDPMERYFQDALNEMVLHLAINQLREQIKEEFGLNPLYAMSPGSLADWPLPAQGPLFEALGDVRAEIGVELTQDFLMVPIKSVSGIFFTAKEEYVNCMLCTMEKCPNRRAPYDPDLYERRYASSQM